MSPSRILIIAEGQLGDLLLLTPALGALKSTFPSCSLSVLVVTRRGAPSPTLTASRPVTGPLDRDANNPLATDPHVDRLYVLERSFLRSLNGIARFRAEFGVIAFLRRERFDSVLCTFPEDRFALYAYCSGAAIRVGQYDQPLRRLLTHTPDIRKASKGVRAYYLDLARAIGARVGSEQTVYRVSSDARRWAASVLKKGGIGKGEKIILIHPGATGPYKIWPPERFAELANSLGRLRRTRVIVCSAPEDHKIVESIRTKIPSSILHVDAGGHIARLAALMEKSDLCITNDSGPRHLAVAMSIPSLALFRRHHDREWKVYEDGSACVTLQGSRECPVCPPERCLDRIPPGEEFGGYCIRMITVEEVLRQAKRMLRRA